MKEEKKIKKEKEECCKSDNCKSGKCKITSNENSEKLKENSNLRILHG